jgi:hypothetical protein
VVMDALKMRKKKNGLGWVVAVVLRSGLIIL